LLGRLAIKKTYNTQPIFSSYINPGPQKRRTGAIRPGG
jgi:hypothetical protein